MKSCIEPSRPTARRTPRAFTLVEMLVVITIIGILVALASVAVFKGLEAAKKARIKAEITNLENAMQQYKLQYGDFPPSDMSDVDAIKRHLAKAFPRCDPNVEINVIPQKNGNTLATYNGSNAMTPAQALVFWLTSYSKDPAHPLSSNSIERTSLLDFNKARLDVSAVSGATAAGWYLNGSNPRYVPAFYVPDSGKSKGFIYFEAKSYPRHATDASGIAEGLVPYLLEPWDVNNSNTLDAGPNGPPTNDVKRDGSNWSTSSFQKLFANPKSFQILSAGLDGEYGVPSSAQVSATFNGNNIQFRYKSFPSGTGYDTTGADDDNLTNFSQGPLGDAKP